MIDEEKLKETYKEIEKVCIQDKIMFPSLLERDFNERYKLNDEEKQEILNNEIIKELTIKQVEKRDTEIKNLKKVGTLEQYYEQELEEFMNKHPNYRKLLIK